MEMLLTADMKSAEFALQIGLVNRVVEPEDLNENIKSLSNLIASKSGPCLRMGKETFNKQIELNEEDAYAVASASMVTNLQSSDAEEGITAFLEKREPRFT